MATDYLDNVAFAFFDASAASHGGVFAPLKELIVRIISDAVERTLADIPVEYLEEIDGIVAGCAAASAASSAGTRVTRKRLLTLNIGIDCLLAHIYSGRLFSEGGYHPRLLRTPIGCNAFSLSGAAAGGKHFFGRDFMFPTADVFQDTACLIIYNPEHRGGVPRQAFVSQTAPGFVGTMTAMSSAGVAIGVNMLPSMSCDPVRPGFNSLLLIRDCMQYCASAAEAVARIAEAQRGVAWLYPVADARGGAYMIEAGRTIPADQPFPYFTWVHRYYRRRLPRRRYIEKMQKKYGTPLPLRGMLARPNDYRYPHEYIEDWNGKLWNAFHHSWCARIVDLAKDFARIVADLVRGGFGGLRKVRSAAFSTDYFDERGCINRTWNEKNCPGPFYFAPQRESRPDVLIATNHSLTPEMRLTSMNEWIALLAGGNHNDIQWRYDELNREILDALDAAPGGIGERAAWDLIDFLRPDGRFPEYYNPGSVLDWRRVQVHGSVSLCELEGRTMTSRFGYYGDDPVTVHLDGYQGERRPPRV